MSDACRSCRAPVIWCLTPKGERAPIDEADSEKGNVLVLNPSGFGLLAVTLSGEALVVAQRAHVPLRLNHFATCPQRGMWADANG